MRTFLLLLFGLAVTVSCAIDDNVSNRRSGQQLVCHKGTTKAVTTGDYFNHQNHGDTIGPCPGDQ